MLSTQRAGNGGWLLPSIMLLLAILFPGDAVNAAGKIHSGHSAMWYMPERNGEGWTLEILPDDHAVVYWFTYDNAGNARWLVGYGDIARADDGDEVQFAHLYSVHGPHFGPDFDPADAVREDMGWAKIRFADCQSGVIVYDAYGQRGTYPLTRLTRTMGANCDPIHGLPGEVVQAYAGNSGSWYDPASDGQGFSLQWLSNDIAGLMWFTFDPQGNPFWLIGTGQSVGEKIVFSDLYAARGGRFDALFDPAAVNLTRWGSLELTLQCDRGTGTYHPEIAGFPAGTFDLYRVTSLQHLPCPWVKPKLDELYDLEWVELPIPPESTIIRGQRTFELSSLVDDGTVVGVGSLNGQYGVLRLQPQASEWELLRANASNPRISADGTTVYAQWGVVDGPNCNQTCVRIHRLSGGQDWEPVANSFENSESDQIQGMSRDGNWLVGVSYFADAPAVAWKWSEASGVVMLPILPLQLPLAISDSGDVAVGYGQETTATTVSMFGLRWHGDGGAQLMTDAEHNGAVLGAVKMTNHDGSLAFGVGWSDGDPADARSLAPWYAHPSGEVVYLGEPDALAADALTYIADVSADGSLVAGVYHYDFVENSLTSRSQAWIWTQATGLVSAQAILDGLEPQRLQHRDIVEVSSDGRTWLVSTWSPTPDGVQSPVVRAALVRLSPKR